MAAGRFSNDNIMLIEKKKVPMSMILRSGEINGSLQTTGR